MFFHGSYSLTLTFFTECMCRYIVFLLYHFTTQITSNCYLSRTAVVETTSTDEDIISTKEKCGIGVVICSTLQSGKEFKME